MDFKRGREVAQATSKLALCLRNARECSRNSWQEPKAYRREYRRIKVESMRDARYWLSILKAD